MIDLELVDEILSQYLKHGWRISRVLLSKRTFDAFDLKRLQGLFGNVEFSHAEFDAVWLERPSKMRKKAIELRHLSASPFALFELVDGSAGEGGESEIKRKMERRMAAHASKRRGNGV